MSWRSGQSYSQDLRERVLAAVDSGPAVRRAATTFGVSASYIYKALIRRRVTGDSRPHPRRGHRRRKLTSVQEAALVEHLGLHPGLTLEKTRAWLWSEHGVLLSIGAMWPSSVGRGRLLSLLLTRKA